MPTLAVPISNSRQLLGTLHLRLRSVSIARVFPGYVLPTVASSHRGILGCYSATQKAIKNHG